MIRRYRAGKKLTQAQVAECLGVTAPAVNKWEKGHSLPDISLLSPIARLLGISTDILLSHVQELSAEEAKGLVGQANERLKSEPYDIVFGWMKQCLEKYPNSYFLTLWMAQLFESRKQALEIPDGEKYDDFILKCYGRVLESDDEALRSSAARSLYYFYFHREQYEIAEKYLVYFLPDNPERKQKQAMLYSRTGRQSDARKMYEELLYAGYQNLNAIFQDIYSLALKDNDLGRARMLVKKIQALAHLFEFGLYHEISAGLELATLEKDEEQTVNIMEQMIANLESICAFTKSPLYSHMNFKEISEDYLAEVRESLLEGFRDEETFSYLGENKRWRNLVGA